MIRFSFIQGMLAGIEWDWENKWFSLNLFIIKIVVYYDNDKELGYGF